MLDWTQYVPVSKALLCMGEAAALCGKRSVPIRPFISDSSQLSLVRVYQVQTADADWQPVKTKSRDFLFLCIL